MEAQEEWRPVTGNADYRVSSLGRVVSLKRRQPRFLRAYPVQGYPSVTLHGTEGPRLLRVHKLVAEAFIGPRPAGHDVRHLDGDRMNPAVANLAYGTRAENVQDSVAHGTHFTASKTHCPKRHPYDEANTYLYGGRRACKTCNRAAVRRSSERRALRAAGIEAA